MSSTYSYSKLDTFQQCPFKFKLRYIDKHYFYNDSINTEIGSAIHACEEAIAKAIQARLTINYIKLKNDLICKMFQLKHKYPKEFVELDKADKTFADKLYFYLETGIYRLDQFMLAHPTYQIVGVELPFKVEYKEQYILSGFIDRLFYDTETKRYIVQDIKTYAVPVEQDKLITPLQFVIYALAVEQMFKCNQSDISCQYYLPFCDLTQDAGTKGYITRGVKKIDKLFDQIANQEFAPNPCPLCNWCEFCPTNPQATTASKYLCPYFCHWDRDSRNKSDINKVENVWQGLENHDTIMAYYFNKVKEKAEWQLFMQE